MMEISLVSLFKSKKQLSFLFLLPLAGILQTLSLAPLNSWPAGLASIVILLCCLNKLPRNKGGLYGWFFGLGLFGSGASWVYVSIHTYGYTPIPLAIILTAGFVMLLALFPALTFKLFTKFTTTNPLAFAIAFSGFFVLGDLFRGWFLTGFPWLYLGYSHINSPLAGWGPIIGVHGLSLITLLSGGAIWLAFSKENRANKPTLSFIIFASLLWVAGFGLNQIQWSHPTSEKALKVTAIQANIPQDEKWAPEQRKQTIKTYQNMTESAWDSDIVIWPETAVPALIQQVKPYLNKLGKKAKETQTAFFTGIPNGVQDQSNTFRIYNSILGLGLADGLYNKQRLVPFGEYIPLESMLRGVIRFFDLPMSSFSQGKENQRLLSANGHKVSPYICYELVYPDFVADRAYEADYLVTLSNDSWFGHSWGPLQHLQMARMRALENARYIIRSTNNGVSAIIDSKGNITARTAQFERTTLHGSVRPIQGRTPFSYTGSLPIIVLSLFAILFGFRRPS